MKNYSIAGPLCFSDDIIRNNIELPVADVGDFLCIKDVGAYTLSMWSRYNSRLMPKVTEFDVSANKFTLVKQKETYDDLVHFWT